MVLSFEIDSDDRALVERELIKALRTDFGRREDQSDASRSGAFTIDASGMASSAWPSLLCFTGERRTAFRTAR